MSEWLFDKNGDAHVYLDGKGIRNRYGSITGYLEEGNVFDVWGNHIGWLENGILYDLQGKVILWQQGATGEPKPRLPKPAEIPTVPRPWGAIDQPDFKEVHTKVRRSAEWSDMTTEEFFD